MNEEFFEDNEPAPVLTPGNLVNKMAGTYDGSDLRDLPGTAPDRLAVNDIPSRMGSWLVYRDGRRVRAE